jgi:hypothetical protein
MKALDLPTGWKGELVDATVDGYLAARRGWLARQPAAAGGGLLVKGAWSDWQAEGEKAGLDADPSPATYARWAHKWDPSEPRSPLGEWTTGPGGDTTTTVTPSRAQAGAARQANRDAVASANAADQRELAAVQGRLAKTGQPTSQKGVQAKAVADARKKDGIPTGKAFKRLSPARKAAAAQILAATRALVRLRAYQARVQARIQALSAELSDHDLRPKTRSWLQARQVRATAVLATIAEHMTSAQHDLAAGRKAWHKH